MSPWFKDWEHLIKQALVIFHADSSTKGKRHRQQNPPVISHVKALRNWTSQHVPKKRRRESLSLPRSIAR